MKWRDALLLAGRNVSRKPGRAILTIVAVALAATLFTALLTIARTAESRVLSQVSKGGALAGIKVVAAAPDPGDFDSDNPKPGAAKVLDEGAVNAVRSLPHVASVARVVSNDEVVVPPTKLPNGRVVKSNIDGPQSLRNSSLFQQVVGVDLNESAQLPITVISGRLPSQGSLTEVAITPAYLEQIGISKADAATVVGSEIQVGSPQGVSTNGRRDFVLGRWTRELVVGVVAQEASPGALLVSIQQAQAARAWTNAGTDVGGLIPKATSPYDGLFVVTDELSDVDGVRNAITSIGYSTSAPENLIASVERYLHVVQIVLAGIGVIALCIASLGITNAMLAAVRERRREIGVLKAIGARDRDVSAIFLIEAAVLGALGGVLGTILGLVIARVVGVVVNGYLTSEGLAGVRARLPVELVIIAVVGSTVIALLAGVLPAMRASRLPAREAVEA